MENFYGMSNDYAFKATLQECEDVLRNLIASLLNIDEEEIVSCTIENPIILGETIDSKDCELDIRLNLNNTENINIELQMRKQDFWPERSLLYWARTYDDLKTGENYDQLKMTYHIGIIDFDVFADNNELYSEYRILNARTGSLYSDKFCTKVLNLKHIDNPLDADPRVIKWARIFKAKTLSELEQIIGSEEVFKNMVFELKKLSEDEKIRQQMRARADYESRLATAKGAGIREGIEQGRESVIMTILSSGKTPEMVAEFTGIPLEKIIEVQQKHMLQNA